MTKAVSMSSSLTHEQTRCAFRDRRVKGERERRDVIYSRIHRNRNREKKYGPDAIFQEWIINLDTLRTNGIIWNSIIHSLTHSHAHAEYNINLGRVHNIYKAAPRAFTYQKASL
jgi:hypothetical protein